MEHYNPTIQKVYNRSELPTYIELVGGGVKQRNAVSDEEWKATGWFAFGGKRGIIAGFKANGWKFVDDNGTWFQEPVELVEISIDLDELRATKATAIQKEKSANRDAGFFVGATLYDSDNSARVAYLELAMKLQVDPAFTTSWKASSSQWVTMNAALYAQVAIAGEAHVSNVFTWQAAKTVELAAAVTQEEIEAVSALYTAPE